MRLFSDRKTYDNNEATWLAIVETSAAIGLVILIICWTEQAWTIGIWSTIGWMYLLRTSISTDRACKLFSSVHESCQGNLRLVYWRHHESEERANRAKRSRWRSHMERAWSLTQLGIVASIRRGMVLVKLIIGAIVVKAVAVIWTVLSHPVLCLRSVSGNWLRAVFCTDSMTPIELVPGYTNYLDKRKHAPSTSHGGAHSDRYLDDDESEKDYVNEEYLTFRLRETRIHVSSVAKLLLIGVVSLFALSSASWYAEQIAAIYDSRDSHAMKLARISRKIPILAIWLLIGLGAICQTPLRVLVYAPTVLCRVILKATSVTYFPLLMGITSSEKDCSLKEQLEEIRDGKWSNLKVKVAWLMILFLGTKIVAYSLGVTLAQQVGYNELGKYLAIQLDTTSIPLWQFASALNGVFTLGGFYFADWALWRMRRNQVLPAGSIRRYLRVAPIIAGILSTYSIMANIWIITHKTPLIVVPAIGPVWP